MNNADYLKSQLDNRYPFLNYFSYNNLADLVFTSYSLEVREYLSSKAGELGILQTISREDLLEGYYAYLLIKQLQ